MAEPGCCSAVPRAVTNTGDRGCRPCSRLTLRQDEVGHVVRFDNRDLVADHARCDRYFRSFAPIFFISTTIAFITPRPLCFAFASQEACNLTRCLVRATHSHQETQGSADSVFAVSDGFGAGRHRRQEFQHPALHGDARDQRRPGPASRR